MLAELSTELSHERRHTREIGGSCQRGERGEGEADRLHFLRRQYRHNNGGQLRRSSQSVHALKRLLARLLAASEGEPASVLTLITHPAPGHAPG